MNPPAALVRSEHAARSAIQHELGELFGARTNVAQTYGENFVRLWALASERILGGKLVRPLLLVATYEALRQAQSIALRPFEGASNPREDGCDQATVIRIASAIEVLHYSFLLHDDVIDGDLTRRGRLNLIGALLDEAGSTRNTAYRGPFGDDDSTRANLHWARTGGILMGDLLLSSAHQTFARVCLPTATRIQLLDVLDHTVTESVAGEQLDVGLSGGMIAPDLETVLTMSTYKTATYTFELPLRAAAILAGADALLESALAAAGRHLGLAFQLQDDFLSTFGDPRQHGKDSFSDLREGKQTALIAYARKTDHWIDIEPIFGRRNLSLADGARLRELLVACGAEQFVRLLIDEQLSSFFQILDADPTQIPNHVRCVLVDLASQLEGRAS